MSTKTPVPSVRIPATSTLRASQCLVGNGLFKQQAAFDPAADMVSVEELVENVKSCEERLSSMRQQTETQHRRTVRSRSPVPIAKRPAWGRNATPTNRAPSPSPRQQVPSSSPRTEPRATMERSAPRTQNRERPWRTGAKGLEAMSPAQEKETIEHDSPTSDDQHDAMAPPTSARRHAPIKTPTVRAQSAVSTAAAKKAAERVASYQRKNSAARPPSVDASPQKRDPAVEELLQRVATLEASLSSVTSENDELKERVSHLEAHAHQMAHNHHIAMSELTGKWIGMSSQVQYLLQQSMNPAAAAPHHMAGAMAPPAPMPTARPVAVPVPDYSHTVNVESTTRSADLSAASFAPQMQSTTEAEMLAQANSITEEELGGTPASARSRPLSSSSVPTARRLDMSSESLGSVNRMPPASPPLHLHHQPGKQ